ncbi:hypothetical protein [Tenacibaculum aquimarinum]|uniref:hypothetical protein n=1 Tax=Tenacibaculum aquimarinum TaxID=2910675 RepID=UPI001F0A8505|nr:hypothetical protein [Tenacibaculum aquimarinum]MCH3883944.1 hypothetical protein [Tenacibaculum aquimarinum]
MKKVVYYFAIFTLILTSCDPLEDIHNEVDALESVVSGEATYTLTEDDYTGDVEDGGLGFSFPNFSSEEDAKAELPAFLSAKYPAWGNESLVTVNFDLYAPKFDERSLEVYTVSSADYAAGGHSYGNFSNFSDITEFLDTKYPAAEHRLLVSLSYKYYSSGTTYSLNNGFINNNGTWEMSTGISDDEYAAMGQGRAQFNSEDEAFAKIPVYAKNKFQYDGKVAGDIEGIMYKLYVEDTQDIDGDGSVTDSAVYSFVVFYIYDGTTWAKYENVIQGSIKFGHDGTSWVPDNTIKYTLTQADYDLVDNGYYANFDVRAGKAEAEESVRLEKINTILKNNFPSDAEGQKYIVSYNVYNGADAVWALNVIKVGTEYVKQ